MRGKQEFSRLDRLEMILDPENLHLLTGTVRAAAEAYHYAKRIEDMEYPEEESGTDSNSNPSAPKNG